LTAVTDREHYGSRVRTLAGGKVAMVKDVMVRLDGTSRGWCADIFESHITGLFFNVLSSIVPDGRAGVGQAGKLLDTAKQAGDIIKPRCSNG
jgi:hypothetical protein